MRAPLALAGTLVALIGCGNDTQPVTHPVLKQDCVKAAEAAQEHAIAEADGTPTREVDDATIALNRAREEGCDK